MCTCGFRSTKPTMTRDVGLKDQNALYCTIALVIVPPSPSTDVPGVTMRVIRHELRFG
jgi:hypothetical protein